MSIEQKKMSRRGFLKAGGALVVMTTAVPAALRMSLAEAAAAGDPFPALDPSNLATWLAVEANGTVVARSGHVELGQGNQTALAQIVAEELDVPFDRVSMVLGNTNQTPDQGVTSGITTIRVAGAHLRQIAAEGRATLLELASQRLGAPVGQLSVKNGVVSSGSRHVSYADLVKGKALTAVAPIKVEGYGGFRMKVTGTGKPKESARYSTVGKSVERV